VINLLPPQTKMDYTYGRRNRHLLHWLLALLMGLLLAILLTSFGVLYMFKIEKNYQSQVDEAKTHLEKQNYAGVEKEVKEVSSNIQLAVQVLSKQVVFSELLNRLGEIMPRDTALSSINIIQTQGALDMTAKAKNYEAGTQIQVNLTDPENKIFTKVDIVSITCTPNNASTASAYPCVVTMRALFAPDSPYTFAGSIKSERTKK